MDGKAAKRGTAYTLIVTTALAYIARPWSCAYGFGYSMAAVNQNPYAFYDLDDSTVTFWAWIGALVFSFPTLWLGSRLFLTSTSGFGIFGRAKDRRTTVLSILVALPIGAPTALQLSYLIKVPTSALSPVGASSLAWLLLVEIGRTAAVRDQNLDRKVVNGSATLALLVLVPKVLQLAHAALAF